MKVSIIIPTHNRSDALAETLKNLSRQQFGESWEAIVVNNNCTDDTDKIVSLQQQNFPVKLLLVNEKKAGAAAARNAGANAATGEYLVFIDNDILTEPNFLQLHYDALRQNTGAWIVGQFVNLPEQEKSIFGKYRKTLFPIISVNEEIRETDAVTGANLSLPRRDFVRLGGFDENFHVASGEDQEFAMRGRRELGVKTLLVPGILVIHNDWAGSTFEDFCRRQQMYSQTEFYFWQKYGEQHPRLKWVEENLPADWQKDSLKLFLRKNIKQMLGRQMAQRILIETCSKLEKSLPFRPLLWRLYKATLVGAAYHGFQQGRKKFLREIKLPEKKFF